MKSLNPLKIVYFAFALATSSIGFAGELPFELENSPGSYIVPAGNTVVLTPTESISSGFSKLKARRWRKLETVFIVLNNIYADDGRVVIEAGTEVDATLSVWPASRAGKAGKIAIDEITLQLSNGDVAHLAAEFSDNPTDNKGVHASAAVGWVVGGLGFLGYLKKGPQAVLSDDEIIQAEFLADVLIQI